MNLFKVWCRKEGRYIASYHDKTKAMEYISDIEITKHFGLLNIEEWTPTGDYVKNHSNNNLLVGMLEVMEI